jgi:hypothetical protein
VAALARLAQLEHRAPRDDLAPVLEEDLDSCFRLQSFGWPSISATMLMPKVSCSCVCL